MRTIGGNSGGQQQPPLPQTLSTCRSNALTAGFKDTFSLTNRGLYSLHTSRYYRPEQVSLLQTLHIDGNVNPAENATLYVIETADGVKGTLTDPLSLIEDPGVPLFFREVESIRQHMSRCGRNDC